MTIPFFSIKVKNQCVIEDLLWQWVGPLLIEPQKEKKKIFGRRKIVPIIHPNICDWVITSSHVKMCTITFIEVTSHWVGTRDCILFAMISPLPGRRVSVVRGGAGESCQHAAIVFDVLPQLLIIVCVFRCFPLVHQVWNCSLVYLPLLLIQQNLGVSIEWHKYTGPGQCSVYFQSAKSSQILSLQFFHLEISQQISSLPIVVPLASSSQHIRVSAN